MESNFLCWTGFLLLPQINACIPFLKDMHSKNYCPTKFFKTEKEGIHPDQIQNSRVTDEDGKS